MDGSRAFKTMRLRYAGVCAGCGSGLAAGTRAHYLPPTRTVRCLDCGPVEASVDAATERASTSGPGDPDRPDAGGGAEPPPATFVSWPSEPAPPATAGGVAEKVLSQGALPRGARCGDCGRKLRRGAEALHDDALTAVLCMECVALDTVHSLGTPGAGARREHARRLERHQTRVRTAHPRLGGLILAVADDPQHVRAWQAGAVGEEEFGRRLSGCSGPKLKVLHDRKMPRSCANIDHLAVTSQCVRIGWGKAIRERLGEEAAGPLPLDGVAKRLARGLRAG